MQIMSSVAHIQLQFIFFLVYIELMGRATETEREKIKLKYITKTRISNEDF